MTSYEVLRVRLAHRLRWRRRACRVVTSGRHWLGGERHEAHVGPVGFEESADTLLWTYRQCRLCYECIEWEDE